MLSLREPAMVMDCAVDACAAILLHKYHAGNQWYVFDSLIMRLLLDRGRVNAAVSSVAKKDIFALDCWAVFICHQGHWLLCLLTGVKLLLASMAFESPKDPAKAVLTMLDSISCPLGAQDTFRKPYGAVCNHFQVLLRSGRDR